MNDKIILAIVTTFGKTNLAVTQGVVFSAYSALEQTVIEGFEQIEEPKFLVFIAKEIPYQERKSS